MIPLARQVEEAATFVRGLYTGQPRVGLILGSGLSDLFGAGEEDVVTIPFDIIPHLAHPTVTGHPGAFVFTRLAGVDVAISRGRLHLYEGHTPSQTTFPVRLLRALGCDILIVTNAAGGLNPAFAAGDLMLISDHIFLPGMAGASPLVGPHEEALGPRFVPLAAAYCPSLRQLAREVAAALDQTIHEGVYAMVAGPHYETPAEVGLLRLVGADAVGMSTCPEVVVARQVGLRVLGISTIANSSVGHEHEELSHEGVLVAAAAAEPRLEGLLAGILEHLGRERN